MKFSKVFGKRASHAYTRLSDPFSVEDDHPSGHGHQLPLHSRGTRWFQRLSILFIGLTIFLSGVLIGHFSHPSFSELWAPVQQPEHETPQSFPPSMPEKTVIFAEIEELMAPPNDENQRYWDSLTPIGHGFVNVSDPEKYKLQPGIPTESGIERFSVAMFHQLHCLALLRRHYFTLMDAMDSAWSQEARDAEHRKQLTDKHSQHCIAYLAQSILCSADLTLEWANVEKNGSRRQVMGWGIPHQCKDPGVVWDWVVQNHGPAKAHGSHIHD